jgi:PEGA domain
VELPFVIYFEPPTRADLRAVLEGAAARPGWGALALVLSVGLVVGGWWTVTSAGAGGGGAGAGQVLELVVSSRPPGARITLDGREQGQTPASLLVTAGLHDVGLLAPQALEARYRLRVDVPERFEAVLWRHQPVVTRLRPTLPGATLASVDVLDDGRLALGVAVPPDGELEAWLLEPVSGTLERLPLPFGASRLAVAPDATRVAVVSSPGAAARDPGGPSAEAAPAVWLVPTGGADDGPRLVWRAQVGRRERLVDLAWSPRAEHLLVGSAEELPSGGRRSHLWLLDQPDATGDSPLQVRRYLVSLPSALVPGSFVWSPDGRRVAFLARVGGQRALCLLDVAYGAFRYLADLDALDASGTPLPFPPVAWSAVGHRLLFVARGEPPSGPFGWLERPRRLLYRVDDDLVARPIGPTDADLVAWREDAQSLVLLGRLKDDGPLVLRAADGGLGQVSHLMELPVRPPAYAARWDLPHARLLLAGPAAGPPDALDYTLVRLGLAGQEED